MSWKPPSTPPSRVIALCDRLTEVIAAEFSDLSPPDTHFALSVLTSTYVETFNALIAAGVKPSR